MHSFEYKGYNIVEGWEPNTGMPLYIVETGTKGSAYFTSIKDAQTFIDMREEDTAHYL